MARLMTFKLEMLKNLFKKPVTRNYPAEPIDFPDRSRGHIEIEIEKCISCSMCALNCPSGALKVDRVKRTWTINRFDCVQCGYCVQKCPKKCLHLIPGYTTPARTKTEEVYQRPPESPEEIAAREAKKKAAIEAAKKRAAAKAAAAKAAGTDAAKPAASAAQAKPADAAKPAAEAKPEAKQAADQKPEAAEAEKKD